MSNTECKYCNNNSTSLFLYELDQLRSSVRTRAVLSAEILQAKDDEEFAKVLKENYCCQRSRYNAMDAYQKYFPYRGMANQQLYIDRLKEDIRRLSQMVKDLTPEKYAEIEAQAQSEGQKTEIWYIINYIVDLYKGLKELSKNTKLAYERETDPKRRELLDGRKKEKTEGKLLRFEQRK